MSLLAIFFQQLSSGDAKREAVIHAVGHSGLAIIMTSLTTAGGLMSFASAALAPIAQDVVICGQDKAEVGALIFAADAMGARADGGALVGDALFAALRARLEVLAKTATGSSTRVARALVCAEPPSVEGQEITAKGNLNPRKVQTRRADLVARLYDDADPAVVRI